MKEKKTNSFVTLAFFPHTEWMDNIILVIYSVYEHFIIIIIMLAKTSLTVCYQVTINTPRFLVSALCIVMKRRVICACHLILCNYEYLRTKYCLHATAFPTTTPSKATPLVASFFAMCSMEATRFMDCVRPIFPSARSPLMTPPSPPP